jgi:hypothetical protein
MDNGIKHMPSSWSAAAGAKASALLDCRCDDDADNLRNPRVLTAKRERILNESDDGKVYTIKLKNNFNHDKRDAIPRSVM